MPKLPIARRELGYNPDKRKEFGDLFRTSHSGEMEKSEPIV
jgi:hypothetical protein